MAAYSDTSSLENSLKYLRSPGSFRSPAAGLAQGIRDWKANRVEKELKSKQESNKVTQDREMQALLQALGGGGQVGGLGPNMGIPQSGNAQGNQASSLESMRFESPEAQALQQKLALSSALRESEFKDKMALQEAKGGDGYGVSPLTYRNPETGAYAAYQPSKGGGMIPFEAPEGLEYVPDSGRMGYNPANINEQRNAERPQNVADIVAEGAATTEVESARTARLANEEFQRNLDFDVNNRTAELEASSQKLQTMNDWIDTAISKANGWTTGLGGTMLEIIPGTPAYDLVALVDTIKANVGFDKLQDMRNNSPTGGALGQVSEFENKLLQAVMGNLENSQSTEQFVQNLTELKTLIDQVVNRGVSSYERDYSAQNQGADIIQQAEAILNGGN